MGNPKRKIDTLSLIVDENDPQFVSAVARAFSILRCFEYGAKHLGNRDIARQTGLPKATVSRLTFTLASLAPPCFRSAMRLCKATMWSRWRVR
jgi:hypothetical protein